ncbi:MAG: hypothetical protein Q4A41_06825, partial [Bacillota bacterium]|nr:hypothetical protein [Bacillota bacterium]
MKTYRYLALLFTVLALLMSSCTGAREEARTSPVSVEPVEVTTPAVSEASTTTSEEKQPVVVSFM